MIGAQNKLNCFLDKDNHCYVLELPLSNTITIGQVFRSIIMRTKTSWKQLADFAGIKKSSIAWQVAYKNRPNATIEMLNAFLVIDEGKRVARFYDKDHKPEGVAFPHVGPSIANGEPSGTTIFTKVPAKITSRLRVTDPLQRMLTMILKPQGGYLLGVRDVSLARPGMTYQVSGIASRLNTILKSIHFVALEEGEGSITISVDDCQGDVLSISSTTVTVKIEPSKEVSIPELNVPGDQSGIIGKDTAIDPITVTDEDNKLIELHVTPFGCYVHGFKNNPFVVGAPYPESKKMEVLYGRPEVINNFISSLYVRPMQEISYLGVEIFCDKTRITKYIKITATAATEEPSEENKEDNNTDNINENNKNDTENKPSENNEVTEENKEETPTENTTPEVPHTQDTLQPQVEQQPVVLTSSRQARRLAAKAAQANN